MRESEARLSALMSASSEVLYVMSPDWREMRWLGGGTFLGDTKAPTADWLQKYIPADTQALVVAAIGEAVRTGTAFNLEHRVRRADGSVGWALSRAIPVLDANGEVVEWFGAASDITARKQAEEALRESERYFRELADLMPQLVWVTDETGSVTYANRQWSEQTGAPVEQCLGDGWSRFLRAEDVERSLAAWQRSVETGAAYQIEHRFRVQNGEYRWYLSRAVAIRDGQGRITRWFGTSTDIEDSKRAEGRLREAQKLESIGVLAAGIAHDFNNILASVIGNASLLLGEVGASQVERVQAVIGDAERAAHLTNQLLAYSGKGQFVVRNLDISEAASRAADLVRPSLPKNVELTMNVTERTPGVRMDPSQLEQVLVNLLINAGEAFAQGKAGKITVGTSVTNIDKPFRDVRGEEVAPGRYVCIEVHDTGAGIPDDIRSKIFDPFFTTKFLGRGLGLAAVAGIVRARNGGITVESVLGRGSSFRVLLPVSERKAEQPETRPGAEERVTVLVVDDEAGVQGFITAALRRHGYRTLTASDGKEALTLCERESWDVDAAIVDLVMPGMAARQFLQMIQERRPRVKILLTSAHDQSEVAPICSRFPGAAFIQKPYAAQQLTEAVERVLGVKDGESAESQRPSTGPH